MKIKVVGIQPQDYKFDSGFHFKGRKLHVIDLDSKSNGQIGHQVTDIKISDDSICANVEVVVGETYNAYFNKRGALDALVPFK